MRIKSMKAAILVEQNQPLVIDKVELPSSLDFGQVLVQIHYSGICGSQLGEIIGVKGPDIYLPHLLGHEGSGVVVEIGPNVSHVKVGDSVVLHWRQGKGIEARPPKYRWQDKPLNAGLVTTFNQHAVVSENRVTKIPDDFDMRIATLFGCAVTTGLGVINNNANVKIGESVVVWGVGGVGLSIVQGAAMVSAYPIIAIDLYDSKLKLAQKVGATHTINAKDINPEGEIKKILGNAGADVIIDNTGNTKIIEKAYELTNPNGKTILVGVPLRGDNISIYTLPLHFNKILKGSHGGEAIPHLDIPRYIRLLQSGKMTLDGLITNEFTLEEINEALDFFRRGEAGRIVIGMNSNQGINK